MSFFRINGEVVPYPAVGLKFSRQQLVDSQRNAKGEVVAQKVNRRMGKFEPLVWKHLTASEWRKIQKLVDSFIVMVEYWDNPSGSFKSRAFYFGDESAQILKIDVDTGEVLEYYDCTVNLIDCGYPDGQNSPSATEDGGQNV